MARPVTLQGLSTAEVTRRRAAGLSNAVAVRSSRGAWAIVRANVLTRFNAIIGALLVVVLVFGPVQDGLFGLIIVVNSAVGIVQELRAKRTLDALALLEQAPVRVRRDGTETAVPPDELVAGDLVVLGSGAKVPVDGELVAVDGLEVDESLLTGEADPVVKQPGETVLSGSFVVAGSGAFTATRVGADAYANRLVAQVRRFDLAHSTLMAGINRFLRIITWVIVPVGILLVISQLRSTGNLAEAMVGSVAGLVPMIPEGLVLMTSVAFAVGVIRLGRRRCLVQELPAVEVLARVDVLCVDKTGTLTTPGMDLAQIEVAPGEDEARVRAVLGVLARADPAPNPTVRAIAAAVPGTGRPVASVPFSSARRYSGATLADGESWLLGAPEVILPAGAQPQERAERLAAQGLRVLALVRIPVLDAPGPAGQPVALVALRQRLRPDAAATLRYLADQGVAVKVLSGDNPTSVGAVAAALGVPGAAEPVDARGLAGHPEQALDRSSVFGRVTPQQKRSFVAALRRAGHTVAMTGDGVNDALALKEADLGIAMGSGSPASRGVAKVVLLDDSFAALPRVLAEGRRVLGNVERVASLFLIKTVYSLVLALLVGVAHLPFPFLPRHITLVGTLTIGIPGFFLALAPNAERARPGFLPRVLRLAVPVGLVCGLAAFAAYGLARLHTPSGQTSDRSAATLTLFLVAAWALALIARPYTWWRAGLVAAMVTGFALAAAVPVTARFFALDYSDPVTVAIAVAAAAAGSLVLTVLHRVVVTGSRRPPAATARTRRPRSAGSGRSGRGRSAP
jgi:cation-transporting P-type ATPase E